MGFGKDGKGVMIYQADIITLDTLADATALLQDNTGNLTLVDDFRVLKTEYFVGTNDTIAAGDGPIYFGMCDGELSVAEIAEQLVMTGPLAANDNDRSEKSGRQIKILEVFGTNDQGSKGLWRQGTWNPRWTYHQPQGWNWFAFNQSGGVLVTGTVLRFRAKHFGVWTN